MISIRILKAMWLFLTMLIVYTIPSVSTDDQNKCYCSIPVYGDNLEIREADVRYSHKVDHKECPNLRSIGSNCNGCFHESKTLCVYCREKNDGECPIIFAEQGSGRVVPERHHLNHANGQNEYCASRLQFESSESQSGQENKNSGSKYSAGSKEQSASFLLVMAITVVTVLWIHW
ncbi:Hypothetical predicted protein [Pelobates cultripes]|uniref:Uncharacterized protein n=1 Tax=Pelobates cultripes TaxID=61616 RepID=A0AAD1T8Y8_PELCU|nr:Hypothetical predicted protein [Pelobates cultripes]